MVIHGGRCEAWRLYLIPACLGRGQGYKPDAETLFRDTTKRRTVTLPVFKLFSRDLIFVVLIVILIPGF